MGRGLSWCGWLLACVVWFGCEVLPTTGPCGPGPGCRAGKACRIGADCGSGDGGFVCAQGVCMARCGTGDACGPGQRCGTVGKQRLCLVECDAGVCPTGVGCQTYWPTRSQVCGTVRFPDACTSVVDQASCTACGPTYFLTPCPDGFFCPANALCTEGVNPLNPNERCACRVGFTSFRCDGQPCQAGACGTNYSCRASALLPTSCADPLMINSGTCRCVDGRELPFACSDTLSCEHRCGAGCSLTRQDCPDAFAKKCTLRRDEDAASARPGEALFDRTLCVANGAVALGERCAIPTDGGASDDCAAGGYCTTVGFESGAPRCRKLCSATQDCASGETCARLAAVMPPAGVCVPAGCTAGGMECGAGRSCMWLKTVERERVLTCKVDGPGAQGTPCSLDSDCGRDLGCNGTCKRLCGAGLPACPSGMCERAPEGAVISLCSQ